MSGPTIKLCLDHPQKLIQIFQVDGRAGRFGSVKPGHCSKYSPIYIFSRDTFKIVIDSAKKNIQTFLYSAKLKGDPLSYKFAMVDRTVKIIDAFLHLHLLFYNIQGVNKKVKKSIHLVIHLKRVKIN